MAKLTPWQNGKYMTCDDVRRFAQHVTSDVAALCARALSGEQDAWHLVKALMLSEGLAL